MKDQSSSESTAGSSSYSSTFTESNEMWNQILRMPFEELEKTENFAYIKKVIELVNRYDFTSDDPHMTDKKYTLLVAKLVKLISYRSMRELDGREDRITVLSDKVEELEAKLSIQFNEIARLRNNEEKRLITKSSGTNDEFPLVSEVSRLKSENENLEAQLRKASKRNEELSQSMQIRKEDKDEVKDYNDKISLEFKHLVTKHNRVLEKSKVTEDSLQELRTRENARKVSEVSELARLKEKVDCLQRENSNLAQSRDRAEELCEQREIQALQDMANLRQLTKKILQDEEKKFERLKVEFANYKQEKDVELDLLITEHRNEINEKLDEIKELQEQLEKSQFNADGESDTSRSESSRGSEVIKTVTIGPTNMDKLQRENYELSQEIEQLQIRLDASHEENSRLARIIKDYESGNDGLRRLRHSLGDAIRTNELLQNENTQLRERLQGLEDSQTFILALQELCRRIGVTDEEINSLKPTTTQAYSEVDTLREELNVLKEEVEWLEKDRRHWMNKVRLQPLMDTKLRFELGLTSEQLKQLDHLVDQMKTGKVTLENDDDNYREKYYRELQLRRKDATQFNDYLKGRIDNAIQLALSGLQNGGDSDAAYATFRDRMTGVFSPPSTQLDLSVKQLQGQIESFIRRSEQSELTLKVESEEVAKLRAEVKAAQSEREIIWKERERYRNLVFSHLANEGNDEKSLCGASEKWGEIASALREELKVKDDAMEITNRKLKMLNETLALASEREKSLQRDIQVLNRTHENTNDQLLALRESNEELMNENSLLSNINKDVLRGLEQEKEEHSSSRELIQKIVLLRKREAFLIQRLRRATAEKEEIHSSEHVLRTSISASLKEVKHILEGSSMGCILSPTATTFTAEQDMLQKFHEVVDYLTDGKLYRADSAYLVQLYNVYCSLNQREELAQLKVQYRSKQMEINQLQERLDQAVIDLQMASHENGMKNCEEGDITTSCLPDSLEFFKASTKQWEMKATLWKQKHLLTVKRLAEKEKEVEILEADLSSTMAEVVKVKEQIQNIFSHPATSTDAFSLPVLSSSAPSTVTIEHPSGTGTSEVDPNTKKDENHTAGSRPTTWHFEKEVGRLRSVNFSLLQHSLDMQSINKSLEIQLDEKKQEISLIRSSSDGSVVSEFIAAAIREHTSLREQNLWATIENKKLQLKLTASEANLQVVSNEATSYKLGAYRLYRQYVDQVVKVVDYIRSIQRASEGALSAHRAEILDRRFSRLVKELEEEQEKNIGLSTQCMIRENLVKTLEHQLDILRDGVTEESIEKVNYTLKEAQSKVRESTREQMEAKADTEHNLAKIARLNEHIAFLNEELTRLEFGCIGVSPLDEAMLHNLLELKETVFSAAQAPPLAITLHSKVAEKDSSQDGCRTDITVMEEYKRAVTKQLELEKVCQELREEMERAANQGSRQKDEVRELKETVKGLEDHVAYCERQLQETKKNAEDKEARLVRAHNIQKDVSSRAVDHTIRCLQELLQKKDGSLQQLQLQLQSERLKLVELQKREGERVETLHEEFIRNNGAMIARYEAAINGVREESVEKPAVVGPEGGSTAVLTERVRALTAQVLSLQSDLSASRDLNISLESQLLSLVNQNIYQTEKVVNPAVPCGTSGVEVDSRSVEFPSVAIPQPGTSTTTMIGASVKESKVERVPPVISQDVKAEEGTGEGVAGRSLFTTAGVLTGTSTNKELLSTVPSSFSASTASVDAFSSIIRQQQTIIHSVRLRENTLTQELSLERQRREVVERELEQLRVQAVERGATVSLHIPASHAGIGARAPIEEDLRAQITRMEQEVMRAREALEQEIRSQDQLRQEAQKWREHLDSVNSETPKHREEVEKARQVISSNTELQCTVNSIRTQNEKLVLAATVLKQRLMEEAQRGGTTDRKLQQEIALVQRLGVIQEESAKQIKHLDNKVKVLQKELEEKAVMEEQALQQSDKCQKLIIQLRQQLREKEKQLSDTQRNSVRLASSTLPDSSGVLSSAGGERPTDFPVELYTSTTTSEEKSIPALQLSQMRTPVNSKGMVSPLLVQKTSVAESDTLLPPHLANLMSKEVLRKERDHLQEISSLRASQRRLESDLEETRLQLRAEREDNRRMRVQLHELKKEKIELEERLARATALRSGKGIRKSERSRSSSKSKSFSPTGLRKESSKSRRKDFLPKEGWIEANKKLQKRVEELEASLLERRNESFVGDGPKVSSRPLIAFGQSADSTSSTLSAKTKNTRVEPADTNLYMSSILSLEAVIDALRRKINVDTNSKINEIELKLRSQQRIVQELATEISLLKNQPLTRIQELYHITPFFDCASPTCLEEELLEAKNTAVELQYERDHLRAKEQRLQRNIQELLEDKGLPSNFVPASEVDALHSLVDNLKLVLDSLLKENASLKGSTSSHTYYSQTVTPLHEVNHREAPVQQSVFDSTPLPSSSFSPHSIESSTGRSRSTGALSGQCFTSTVPAEERLFLTPLQDSSASSSGGKRPPPSIPPPLPLNPYSVRRSTQSSTASSSKTSQRQSSSSSSAAGSSSQRRLSSSFN